MARKSTDFSQSLLQFQSNAKNKRVNTENEPKSPSSAGSETETKSGKNKKSKDDGLTLESIRTKYILQNKSLAKNNSLMLTKISDMESKISELINENMKLRKTRTMKDIEVKQQLENKLQAIESSLFSKFEEIFQLLKNVRATEGLSENPQLDVFVNFDRPITSTPIENSGIFRTPFDLNFQPNSLLKDEPTLAMQSNQDPIPKTTVDSNDKQLKRKSISMDKNSKDLQISSYNKEKYSVSDFELQSEDSANDANQTLLDLDGGGLEDKEKYKITSPILEVKESFLSDSLTSRFEIYKDEKNSNDNKNQEIMEENKQNEQKNKENNNIENQSNIARGNDEETQDNTKGSNQKISKSPTKDTATTDSSTTPTGKEIARRSSRNRKQVNYAPPPLRGKMRRESVKLLDAVGDDVLISHVIVKDNRTSTPTIKEETPNQEGKIGNNIEDNKKKRKSEANLNKISKKVQRIPLGNVTNENNNKSNISKSADGDKKHTNDINNDNSEKENGSLNDLSVFDFVEDISQSKQVYAGKKSLNRKARRRHSMLL